MVSRATIAALIAPICLASSSARAQDDRVAIVDLAGNSQSANAVGEIRDKLAERTANEPDVRAALEEPLASETNHLAASSQSLRSAQSKFADFSLAAAITDLRRAESEAIKGLPTDGARARKALAEIHLLWGRVSDADGVADAIEHFRTTARLDPERRTIDPGQFKPSLVALYAKAVTTAEQEGKGSISLQGSPSGAVVEVDGQVLGEVPLTISKLADGTHFVAVRAVDFKPQAFVSITRGKKVRIEVELEPKSRREKLAAVRRKMGDGSQIAAVHLAELSAAASAKTIIVVRQRNGQIEAAAFERGGTLGQWGPPGALTFRASEPILEPVVNTSGPAIAAERGSSPRPWYAGWKGAATVGVVAGAITVAAILLARGGTEFEVGGICSGEECR